MESPPSNEATLYPGFRTSGNGHSGTIWSQGGTFRSDAPQCERREPARSAKVVLAGDWHFTHKSPSQSCQAQIVDHLRRARIASGHRHEASGATEATSLVPR